MHRLPIVLAVTLSLVQSFTALGSGKTDADTSTPVRIVSLAPNLTEIICAIGGESNLVGRTSYCNYPPEIVTNVPIVGGFGLPSMEALLTIQPTHILEVDLEDESVVQQLEKYGFERRRINCKTLNDIPLAIEEIGRILGRNDEATRLAMDLSNSIALLRTSTSASDSRPRVFLQIWGDPIMTATPKSFISELLHLAGGDNICTNGSSEFIQVSSEWVVGTDPDVVLCLEGDGSAPSRDLVMSRPGWNTISAVKSGRVFDHFNMDILTRPGPRVLEGVEMLRAVLGATNLPGVVTSP